MFFNANYQYVDARQDAFFDGNTYAIVAAKLGSYQLLNALVKYELVKDRLTIFGNAPVTLLIPSNKLFEVKYVYK